MERAHGGMTMQQLRALQFHLEALGLEEKYVELNGEMPLAGYGWEPELDGVDSESRVETMPSVDRYLERDTDGFDGDDSVPEYCSHRCRRSRSPSPYRDEGARNAAGDSQVGQPKVNGYVRAVLALEAVRRKRNVRYDRFVRPLDRKRDALAAEVVTRMRALTGRSRPRRGGSLGVIDGTIADQLPDRMTAGQGPLVPPPAARLVNGSTERRHHARRRPGGVDAQHLRLGRDDARGATDYHARRRGLRNARLAVSAVAP